MRIGVSSYSYQLLVNNGTFRQEDLVKLAAEAGFELIEFAGLIVPEGESKEHYAARLRELCGQHQIAVGNYTIGADFLNLTGGSWRDEVERLQKEVDIAVILGATGMRHDVTTGRRRSSDSGARLSQAPAESFADVVEYLARCCREVSAYAEQKQVRTMLENHGTFCQDSERVEQLISKVNHPNYGLLADIGNFLCVDEDPAVAVGRIAPYIFHLHAKDFHYRPGSLEAPGRGWFATRARNWLRGAIVGHGIVPVRQCIDIVSQAGYEGDVSIEFEGLEDPRLGLDIGLENLRAMIQS